MNILSENVFFKDLVKRANFVGNTDEADGETAVDTGRKDFLYSIVHEFYEYKVEKDNWDGVDMDWHKWPLMGTIAIGPHRSL